MDNKKMQRFKLMNLLKTVVNFIDIYKQKDVLTEEIDVKDYNDLQNIINEFISKHSD